MKKKNSYGVGRIYTAVIRKIKNDRIFFDIKQKLFDGETDVDVTKKAVFYIKQKNFNPFIYFKEGKEIEVEVVNLYNPNKNFYYLDYEVMPLILPVDEYIQEHPVGTMVEGTIENINGATMIICLAPNVYALTKRSKHARTGKNIICKIDRYHNKKLSLRVF